MELKVSRIDLAKTQANWPAGMAFAPRLTLPRPVEHVERWLVVSEPVVPGQPPVLSESYQDPYVSIPLFAYRLNPASDLALAYMVQLGLSCAAHTPAEIKKLHVVTGYPVDLLYEDGTNNHIGIRYWFGFAFVIQGGK